ncbi:MAG: DUF1987 domain-containing protein [bacterium]|nr:DUF1987 domain-containing protein [bacterium]
MKNLIIKATKETPFVDFSFIKGVFIIKGRSIPENPGVFYSSLIKYANEYVKEPKDRTELHLDFEYINTSSLKYLSRLLQQFTDIKNSCIVEFHWYFHTKDEVEKPVETYSSRFKYLTADIPCNKTLFLHEILGDTIVKSFDKIEL